MEWKIFYPDGSYSDEDGPPELAPKCGVQAIAVKDKTVGRRIERSEDFYIYTPEHGGWRGANQFRMTEYLMMPGLKIVLFGRTLVDDDYRAVLDRATTDSYLPRKSAILGYEKEQRR